MHIHTCIYNTLSPFGIACMYICPLLSTLRLDNLYNGLSLEETNCRSLGSHHHLQFFNERVGLSEISYLRRFYNFHNYVVWRLNSWAKSKAVHSNKPASHRHVKPPTELLLRGIQESPITTQAIVIARGYFPELEGRPYC